MLRIQNISTSVRYLLALFVGAAVVAAVMMPSSASASALESSGGTAGGSADISGTGDTQVVIDDTDPAQILTTKKVGGGTWIYGTGGGNSYSYYDHKTKKHSSTACSGYGTSCRGSGWVAKEKRSVAKVLKTAWGNTAFWNTK